MPVPLPVSEVIEAMPLPALAVASSEQIIAINAAAQTLLGMPAQGRHFITVLRQPSVVEAVERCLGGVAQTDAEYLTREHGNDVSYRVSVNAVGATGIALLTFQDTTMLMTADQMRRDFVANVSHELRTPLTAVMGFIETLQGSARDDVDARARFLKIMQSETERMNRLVGDLLSLSRVEAAQRVRPTAQVNIAAILRMTLRNLTPLAVEAGVVFVPDIPDGQMDITGDTDQLQQVFTNLIENAIKYGGAIKPATTSQVFVSLSEPAHLDTLRGAGVVVRVRDEGQGIEAQHLPRLTERFYRADSHRSAASGGTGLGLAIVKHILNRHRGRIKITSTPGQGAEFTVILPL